MESYVGEEAGANNYIFAAIKAMFLPKLDRLLLSCADLYTIVRTPEKSSRPKKFVPSRHGSTSQFLITTSISQAGGTDNSLTASVPSQNGEEVTSKNEITPARLKRGQHVIIHRLSLVTALDGGRGDKVDAVTEIHQPEQMEKLQWRQIWSQLYGPFSSDIDLLNIQNPYYKSQERVDKINRGTGDAVSLQNIMTTGITPFLQYDSDTHLCAQKLPEKSCCQSMYLLRGNGSFCGISLEHMEDIILAIHRIKGIG